MGILPLSVFSRAAPSTPGVSMSPEGGNPVDLSRLGKGLGGAKRDEPLSSPRSQRRYRDPSGTKMTEKLKIAAPSALQRRGGLGLC